MHVNAAMDADRPTLRALLWCPAAVLPCALDMDVLVSRVHGCTSDLGKDRAIACARRLAAKHHRNAES